MGRAGAATRTPMGRRVYPNGLAASAASAHDQAPATPLGAAQQHGLYRSAPTSPQIGNLGGSCSTKCWLGSSGTARAMIIWEMTWTSEIALISVHIVIVT